ncbi:MAG: TetR/AcrR family transcriptional regulator [Caulobacteraceae bacterium]|nr:MAG: TetR/AcrR family transcriptional regulator [Caulobacteraceae bacterium]
MARTGRPRAFDRDAALNAAMRLFWAQGYEPTSLSQLKAVMGDLSTASFYAAFSSKEALFREVIDLYLATYGRVTRSLQDQNLPPRQAVETALRQSARMQSDGEHPRGCFITLGANNCSPENAHVARLLEEVRRRDRAGIEARLMQARAAGEVPPDFDITPLATVLSTLLAGVAIEARDGRGSADLDAAISQVMTLWPASIA